MARKQTTSPQIVIQQAPAPLCEKLARFFFRMAIGIVGAFTVGVFIVGYITTVKWLFNFPQTRDVVAASFLSFIFIFIIGVVIYFIWSWDEM